MGGALYDLWLRTGRGPLAGRLVRLTRLPRADWGKATAHSGLGVTIFAVAAMLGWATEDIRVARLGESFTHGNYTLTLTDVQRIEGPNYISTMAFVQAQRTGGDWTRVLTPEKRNYYIAGMPTTEAAIHYGFSRDLYLALGDPQEGGGWALRTYIKPFANWLWGGCILMALGGLISLSDRRYRVAAGAGRTPRGAAATPAE